MQSVRIKVSIRNHKIAAELPPEVPDGEAEAVIHYQEEPAASLEQARRRHLEALFDDVERSGEGTLTRKEIDQLVVEERTGWGE